MRPRLRRSSYGVAKKPVAIPKAPLITSVQTDRSVVRLTQRCRGTITPVIDRALRDHLAQGVSIIVGTSSASGRPHATRGYGAVAVDDFRLLLFISAADVVTIENALSTGRIAMTTGDQRTYQSVQCKGSVESIADAAPDEHAAALKHMERFWDRVNFEDNISLESLKRMTPTAYAACVMRVETMFDQAPGPSAGGALTAQSS